MIGKEIINKMIDEGLKAREYSYSPYSHFKVGAAILLKNGTVIHGCNVENASYGLSNCAERTALFKMISEGYNKNDVECFLVIGQSDRPISPCGACRQVMCELLNLDTTVILANLNRDYILYTVKDLLPYQFNEEDL